MSAHLPGTHPEKLSALTLGDREAVVRVVWPEPLTIGTLMLKCMDVESIARGGPAPSVSRKEREAVEAELKRRRGA
jgi:hypothetical protein